MSLLQKCRRLPTLAPLLVARRPSRIQLFSSMNRSDEPSENSGRLFNSAVSFRVTDPPNPNWQLRQGLPDHIEPGKSWKAEEEKGWKTWNLSDISPREVYPLLTSCIVPRPIALVSSTSSDGMPNLAPFSYFSMVAHNPSLLSISFSHSPRTRKSKDTKENILATKQFTVSIMSEPFIEAANITSVDAPADIDEWDISGLTGSTSIDVRPPWVKESAIGFECELFHSYEICPPNSGEVTNTLVLGLIKRAHIRESVLTANGTVDPAKLRAVSRLGGNMYARIGEGFELSRPPWKVIRDQVISGAPESK
ncbi:flavoprotein oxygenase [Suillus subaureus]|uniref:Flavoprotein oxygenase n=1 Tax=Suillus subaureus TaxID=48587 RepID=A0A9P7EA85_9AGAM|nr:flavoprotein oxygenase [Suillus subaureus]KAG1815911.1 flavoprotein oxygenase [Suillus subaureus]